MKAYLEDVQADTDSSFRLLLTPHLNDFFLWHFHRTGDPAVFPSQRKNEARAPFSSKTSPILTSEALYHS